jgi:hypothetical protein
MGSFVNLNTPRPVCCLTKISTTAAAIKSISSVSALGLLSWGASKFV